jgi:peptidoglycan/xylan/chitin deacetylase (PgdA/CDA1 family)
MSLPGGLAASGAAALVAGLAWGMFVPQSRLFGNVISHGPRENPSRAALTFDDGPWPGSTDVILDILREHHLKAAFFVIGRYARQWPDLIRRIHAEGHLIGNHTFDHHRWGLWRDTRYWHTQIAATDDAIAEIIGERPHHFRPPMGFKSPQLVLSARRLGHPIIAWSRRGRDGVTTTPQRIISALSGTITAGDIVLLHDGRDPASRRDVTVTAGALPAVINALRDRGISLIRLDELIDSGCAPSGC